MTSNSLAEFQKIKHNVLQNIKDGIWLPGSKIPREEELALQYNCSRMTVNRAMRELAEEGVVERRKKAGTIVSTNKHRTAKFQIKIIRNEIEGKGADYRFEILERKEMQPPEGIRAKMSLKKGLNALYIRSLHFADDMPYQYEQRWINLQRVPHAAKESFEDYSPNEWLVLREPFSNVEHIFSAQIADEKRAELLNIEIGSPLFVIERRTWQDDDTITTVKLTHPGCSFKLASR